MAFDPKKLSQYPKEAGVYLMKDSSGRVLYVGKAKSLKSRLRSYFAASGDTREMIPHLRKKISDIDTIVVATEREALLLENTLIKKHIPKYNVLLKDDKSYVSLILTKHEWPALRLTRSKKRPKEAKNSFGPYTNAKVAREMLDLLSRIFPLRECSDNELLSRSRPCLLYGIKRCIAPCVKLCSKEEYQAHVRAVKNLLLGKNQDIITSLEKQMEEASEKLLFEKAANIRDILEKIRTLLQKQHVKNIAAKHADSIGLYRKADHLVIVKLIFRDYQLVGSEHFSFSEILSSDEEVIESFLIQHYKKEPNLPKEIFLPVKKSSSVEEILCTNTAKRIVLTYPQKGDKKVLVTMAEKNAKAQFEQEEDKRSLSEKMLLDLQEHLSLENFPRKIECIDSSNISGTSSVAAIVLFENGERKKEGQRYFKLKNEGEQNDYAALKEVLYRQYKRHKENNSFPDLLIIDGGRGHVNSAMEVLNELEIANVDLIGVSKDAALHTKSLTQEKVFLPHEKEPKIFPIHSPILFLLQKIRDEAHRVAHGFHQKRRGKNVIQSALDKVPGIGPKKKKALLTHFGSVKRVKEATDEELKERGLSPKDVENLRLLL